MRTDSRELLAVGILGATSLSDRIEMLLKRGRDFSPRASFSRVAASAAVLLTVAISVSLAPRWIAFAQEPSDAQFEVASIKRNISPETAGTWRFAPGGRFTGENISLRLVIITAYRLRDIQLSGVPNWGESEKYDIAAKAQGNPTQDQLITMLQGLLRERFKFRFHRVTRELPVYDLVAAKNGIRLQQSREGSCVIPSPGVKPSQPEVPPPAYCGTYFAYRSQIDGARITMAQFVAALAFKLDRPVIDKTKFIPFFDVHLAWIPEETPADAPGDNNDPSISNALQQQLGLRLQSAKGPAEVLVIDHLEKPSDN